MQKQVPFQSTASTLALTAEQLRALVQEDREQTLLEWQRRQDARKLTAAQAALRCGRIRADGSPNTAAFKTFLARHPDLPRTKAGRRLVFDEMALDRWLADRHSLGRQDKCHVAG